MALTLVTFNRLVSVFGEEDASRLADSANRADRLEKRWVSKLDRLWDELKTETIKDLEMTGVVSNRTSGMFLDFYVEQAFSVMLEAIKSTRTRPRVTSGNRLKQYPKGPMPRSLSELRKLWDLWRQKKRAPARQAKIAESIKNAYVKKCQATWREASDSYRQGKTTDRESIVAKVQQAADTQYARAKTIVETETTRYWNKTRKEIYGQAEDVTHFLFVPVRDHATTKWCKSRRGLVYAKGDPILDKETPPIHWNCRSELLPLSIMNPRHLVLIENKSLWRRNNSCEPLPAQWNAA